MSNTQSRLPEGTTCWVVTNGLAGFEMQALGITERLGLSPSVIRVSPGAPYSWLAPWGPAAPDENIKAPWPDLVIAGGRQAIPYALHIKRKSRGKSFIAILQDPKINPKQVDFIWAPVHDHLVGDSVLSTLTAPNRITPERLAEAKPALEARYAALPARKIAVVIGGPNSVFSLGTTEMRTIATKLKILAETENVGLMVTTSRRTGKEATAVLKKGLEGVPHNLFDALEDPAADNPYPGMLGLAEAIITTCDSHNMVGEATSTGRPVYIIELPGGSPKFRHFLDALYVNSVARQFDGLLATWSYAPLNATEEIAAAIAERFALKNA
ncbi:MAG: mitochondrial fission ELM1 family protein [Parvibaculum sp.]